MRVPDPPITGNPELDEWASSLTENVQDLVNRRSGQLLIVPYAKLTSPTPTIRRTLGVMIYCPDYPDGPSILLADGTAWQVFTASGSL